MTEFIMHFETQLSNIMGKGFDSGQLKRTLLYILAPILRLPTINKLCSVFKLDKNSMYESLAALNEGQWLKLLRLFAYARVFTVIRKNQELHPSNQSRNRITIGTDDSAMAKSGKKMPLVSTIWMGALKKLGIGTQLLYFFVVIGEQKHCFPLDWRLCRGRKGRRGRATKSKNQLVVEMMHDFHQALLSEGLPTTQIVFVADAWFNAPDIYQAARACGFSLVIRGKKSYGFTIDGERVKAAELAARRNHWRTSAKDGGRYARYAAVHDTFGQVILTFYRLNGKVVYLISTNPDHSSPKIIHDFELRWSVEVCFKDCKQNLFIDKCSMRDRAEIFGHYVLRTLAYHLMGWIRVKMFKRKKTIGQCCDWLYYCVLIHPSPNEDKLGLHKLKSYLPDFKY